MIATKYYTKEEYEEIKGIMDKYIPLVGGDWVKYKSSRAKNWGDGYLVVPTIILKEMICPVRAANENKFSLEVCGTSGFIVCIMHECSQKECNCSKEIRKI